MPNQRPLGMQANINNASISMTFLLMTRYVPSELGGAGNHGSDGQVKIVVSRNSAPNSAEARENNPSSKPAPTTINNQGVVKSRKRISQCLGGSGTEPSVFCSLDSW